MRKGDVVLQARGHTHPGRLGSAEAERRPHVRSRVRKFKLRRHHPDDAIGLARNRRRLPENIRVSTKPAPPVAVAEEYHVVLGLGGRPADERTRPQHGEQAAGGAYHPHLFGCLIADGHHVAHVGSGDAEQVGTLSPLEVLGGGDADVRTLTGRLLEPDQAGRRGVRERADENRIHDAEDSSVDTDSERQNRDDGGGEERIVTQPPHGPKEITRHTKELVYLNHQLLDIRQLRH